MADEDDRDVDVRDAERTKFFTDAVVAIAMTLLILPLIESVAEAGRDLSTSAFLHEHRDQLLTFVISFLVIAQFWVNHERMFDRVEYCSPRLRLLNVAWMLTIVFLPVPTAMSGAMRTDSLQLVIYIGTMLASSLVMAVMNVLVRADRRLTGRHQPPTLSSLANSIATPVMFALALVLALVVPGLDYSALYILLFTFVLQRTIGRLLLLRGASG
ncbi:DUF1211 domain-containing protein [Nocardioides mangrovicus]|uniref:DUF1211 domain-containing protein n=1 Tax=Nocardioides mangrovicus TaxID=2478913 RepID=A0A3L8P4J2_9ACTN|nr:TMEM175 family protein [Nocardioides mangrovicus]RLV49479.1 DUF1211 domain-containing protein [Nocardioides mangrovicus]